MTAKGPLTHNRFWRNGGPYLGHVPSGIRERGKAAATPSLEEAVVKYHSRPSTQYRYEHYDPITGA